ncbi:MAG: acetyl-CoA carboxylase biotin carboxyl carrier protein [Rubrobacter sp.]|nr:acetyl-CoA carboxylase biotin carboxyl carrier protein [Rubrobacter sp.]
MPLEDVGRLVELVQESGVGEIRVRQGDLEITVRAREEAAAPQQPRQVETQAAPEPPGEPASAENASAENASAEAAAAANGLHEVRSPVVGTFYRAPAPGESDYVDVGDTVREGQTLCIVEAMKLMNEIPADISGEVVEVLAENAKGVQYDQPLFHLRPEA